MFVGFYDKGKGRLIAVESVDITIESARLVSMELSILWKSRKHRLPSSIWCVWSSMTDIDSADSVFSIFALDLSPPSYTVCRGVEAALRAGYVDFL